MVLGVGVGEKMLQGMDVGYRGRVTLGIMVAAGRLCRTYACGI